ncbi:hypothetical protein ACLOJK_040081 [Asimina triloba]
MRAPHVSVFSFAICLLSVWEACKGRETKNEEMIKGMFVFGSSLVDNGNNNYARNSSARADYLPYGIDFPLGPSGRFSNGRNPIDILGDLLKLPGYIPVFADPRTKGARILHGVNYASGGSGILDETGPVADNDACDLHRFREGGVTSLNRQIQNFQKTTMPELRRQLGCTHRRLSSHLSKYLFVVGTGGNDYLLNYFLRDSKSSGDPMNLHNLASSLQITQQDSRQTTLQDFTNTLITTFSKQLKWLYGLGGRKFVLLSVQVMGCLPVVREALSLANGSCAEPLNEAALLFNHQLKSTVDDIKHQMPAARLAFVNSYKIIKDIINNPTPRGFKETSKACCDVSGSKTGGGIMCKKGGKACSHRNSRVFFDGLHPTDAVNTWIAKKAFASNLQTEVYPMNVKQLARLNTGRTKA